jgi:hypothetical protein
MFRTLIVFLGNDLLICSRLVMRGAILPLPKKKSAGFDRRSLTSVSLSQPAFTAG